MAKVGLALGAGAARGWSHIGVAKGLQDMGVKIDIVAGTSIGSIAAVALACGRLPELEAWGQSLTKADVYGKLGLSLTARGGFVTGDKFFDDVMRTIGATKIEDLPLKFAAVACDLDTGKEIWIKEGLISDAVRASTALPLLVPPRRMYGRWLVDGGLVNPIPVSVCRALGADIVIAVNLNGQLVAKLAAPDEQSKVEMAQPRASSAPEMQAPNASPPIESQNAEKKRSPNENAESSITSYTRLAETFSELIESKKQQVLKQVSDTKQHVLRQVSDPSKPKAPNILQMALSSVNIMQDRITKARMAGDPPEILVTPRVGEIGTLEFWRATEAIAEGYASVNRMRPIIEHELGRA